MKKTQYDLVYRELQSKGYITRNECLARSITRLASIINVMKKSGWEFETKKVNGDYKYIFIDPKEDYTKEQVVLDLFNLKFN